jgi:hypothetical protein
LFLCRAFSLNFAVQGFVAVRHFGLCRARIHCRALLSDLAVRSAFVVRAACCARQRGNDWLHGNAFLPRSDMHGIYN